jgi:choline dehydrogenase-like flavoprotein
VVTGARVRLITTDGRGRATGAIWIDRDGAEHLEQADVVVLAANGVGTPRLLLLSTSGAHPDGLANSSGLVGKRLMLHPCASVVGVYEEQLESWLGPAGQLIQSMQFYESDGDRGFVRGGKWDLMPSGGPLRMVQLAGGRTGSDLQRFLQDTLGHAIDWGTIAEDLPDEANTVTLDGALSDSDGIPAPRITYRIAENTQRLIDFHLERMREAHEAAGAVRTVDLPLLDDQPGHLMGTARMGRDPASSVVESNGRTHDVPNLYVIDGSVFVTAGGCNPTATIAALALRFAEGIATDARLVQVPA